MESGIRLADPKHMLTVELRTFPFYRRRSRIRRRCNASRAAAGICAEELDDGAETDRYYQSLENL